MASQGVAATKAPSGKKKGTTLHLTSFLKPELTSWADDDPEGDVAPPPLPTAPGASQGSHRDYGQSYQPHHQQAQSAALPTQPPYKAYVGNLASNTSAEDIGQLFHKTFEVIDVHVLKHQDTGRVKGAFVEFASQEDLRGGLSMSGQMFAGRPLRVDVATGRRGGQEGRSHEDRGRYDDSRRGGYDDRGGYSERGSAYGDRLGSYDNRYQERPDYGSRGGYGSRGSFQDRRGGPDMLDRRHPSSGYSEEDSMERWGHKQPPAPVHSPRHQGPRGAPAPSPEAPTERKRLVLAPRSSKPVDEGAVSEEAVGESASEKPRKSNPFGAAKPIDAEVRLKELEAKIAKEKAEAAAAAQEAEQKLREQAEEAVRRDQEAAGTGPQNGGASGEDSRAAGSGRPQGPPPGSARSPGPPPSGSGRGQGRGASLDAANGRLSVPPGMESSREGYGQRGGRGRRGKGREGGRSRGDYGSRSDGGGRGRSYGDAASHGGPTNILTHRNSSTDSSGFQEAGPAKIKGRNRGWETQTPATASKAQEPASQGGDALSSEKEAAPAKAANKFEMLTLEE